MGVIRYYCQIDPEDEPEVRGQEEGDYPPQVGNQILAPMVIGAYGLFTVTRVVKVWSAPVWHVFCLFDDTVPDTQGQWLVEKGMYLK